MTLLEITRIRLENIRGFRELDLQIPRRLTRRLTLIVGKNGTCKTTILRAIAIGLADRTDASRLISEPLGGFISSVVDEGSISLKLSWGASRLHYLTPIQRVSDKEQIEEKVPHRERLGGPFGESSGLESVPEIFVCGYGAGRYGSGPDTGRGYRIADAVATLFRYQQHLIDPELTLHRLQTTLGTAIYDRTLRGLKRALGLSDEDEIAPRTGGGIVVSGPNIGGSIPFEAWADGYRLTFSWLLDLYAWAMKKGSIDEDGHVEGILLLDEIEQHLHPSMQAEILPRLSELLPKMQIFATTHSPLVALDASPEELVVLRREGDHIVAEQNVPNFLGYSVEDMLADPRLFDTEIYGHETRAKLEEYRELAAVPQEQRDPEQRSHLRSLAAEISSFSKPVERESETSRILKQLIEKHNL